MWPFEKKFINQDPIGKYRRWLRRWLFGIKAYFLMAGVLTLLLVIAWVAVYSGINRDITIPAFDNGAVSEVTVNYPGANYQVVQQEMQIGGNGGDCGITQRQSTSQNRQRKEDLKADSIEKVMGPNPVSDMSFSKSESSPVVSQQGLVYSEKYNDYRFNGGLNILAESSQLVRAPAGGMVTEISQALDGITVEIDHGGGWSTKCQGLSNSIANKGQRVIRGETIGYCVAGAPYNVILIQSGIEPDAISLLQD